jgi:hypothetical protein
MSQRSLPDDFNVDEPTRTRYVLGHGTSDEQSINWPDTHRPLRNYFASVQETLILLRNTFASRGQLPQVAMVDGIWLTWVYCAMDVQRLNAETQALRDEVDAVRSQLAAMGEVFADLGMTLQSGTPQPASIGRVLQAMGEALLQKNSKRALARVPKPDVYETTATED